MWSHVQNGLLNFAFYYVEMLSYSMLCDINVKLPNATPLGWLLHEKNLQEVRVRLVKQKDGFG